MEASKIRLTVPEGIDASCVLGAGDGVLRALESLVRAHVVARGDSIALSGDPDEVELVARFSNTLFARRLPGARCLSTMSLAAWPSCATVSTRLRRFAMTCCFRIAVVPFAPKRSAKSAMWMPSARIPSRLAWVLPAPVRLICHGARRCRTQAPRGGPSDLDASGCRGGGESGFLPGTLEEKIDPYMRPLYDALFDMMDRERTDELMERGVIEIAPLAYMRGRTLSDAFVVLDEAQNTTPEQMKMFLTDAPGLQLQVRDYWRPQPARPGGSSWWLGGCREDFGPCRRCGVCTPGARRRGAPCPGGSYRRGI